VQKYLEYGLIKHTLVFSNNEIICSASKSKRILGLNIKFEFYLSFIAKLKPERMESKNQTENLNRKVNLHNDD